MAVLLDPYGRKLEYLRVSVEDHCNLHCFYCRPGKECEPHRPRGRLDAALIVRAVAGAASAGIRKVRLTGGEPLIRQDIVRLVEKVARISAIEDLSLTTNGTKLARLAAPLADAGLKRVNISLDSLDRDNFRQITRGDSLMAVLKGIDAAFQADLLPVKINMVVMKGINDHEVEKFARMTLDRNIHIRFIEYMPMLGQERAWKEHYLPSAQIMALCENTGPLLAMPEDDKLGPARHYRYEKAAGRLGFITPVSQHFCSRCNRLRLTSDGKIKPCLFSPEEVDLLSALLDGSDLLPFYLEAARRKPKLSEVSPAAQGAACGPCGMVEIGG